MDEFRDPIFKGCTRPAMFLGVPLIPFLLISGGFMVVGMWGSYLIHPLVALGLLAIYLPLLGAMRHITKQDDQRLRQVLRRLMMRVRHDQGRRFWGAISYGPLRFKKRGGSL